jgi:hypothetical protein
LTQTRAIFNYILVKSAKKCPSNIVSLCILDWNNFPL